MEARKPFEYEDETGVGGFLALFFVMMISGETGYGFIALGQLNKVFGSNTAAGSIAMGISVLYLAGIAFTCFALFKLGRYAVRIVKSYLATRVVYLSISSIIVFIHTYTSKTAIGDGPEQFESVPVMVLMLLITPLLYTLIFSIAWHVYFSRSKRVKALYGK